MYSFSSQYLVTLYFVFSAAFRCKACSFPDYLTSKSSTTNVKFIGWMLCFHSPEVLLEGCYIYRYRCLNRASCAIRPAWGCHKFPLLPLHRCIQCVLFLRDSIFLQILVVSLKSGSWCIIPFPYSYSGRNPLDKCTCILIWRVRWRFLYGVSWLSILMWVCWLLLDNLSYYLLQWVLFYGSLFFVVGYRIPLSHYWNLGTPGTYSM